MTNEEIDFQINLLRQEDNILEKNLDNLEKSFNIMIEEATAEKPGAMDRFVQLGSLRSSFRTIKLRREIIKMTIDTYQNERNKVDKSK